MASKTKPMQTQKCISHQTFRNLPLEVQLDYAQYYGLPSVEQLTSDEICDILFKETEWTPALEIEGHVQLETAEGAVVGREVMDLVDWLVEHPTNTTSPRLPVAREDVQNASGQSAMISEAQDSSDRNNERYDLQTMSQELQRTHARTKASIEESQKAAREACADMFILQSRLNEENAYQSQVLKAITSIVGIDVLQRAEEEVDVAKYDDGLSVEMTSTQAVAQKKMNQTSFPEKTAQKRVQNASATSYHILPRVQNYQEGHIRRSLKRGREFDDSDNGLVNASTSSNMRQSPSRTHKKPRPDEPSLVDDATISIDETPIALTIMNYPSGDDHDEADSSYSDSNGTERDFIDDPYSFYGCHGEDPWHEELWSRYSSSEADGDFSDSASDFRWSETQSDSECFSDPDYQPLAEWDLENALELNPKSSIFKPLYRFKYIDELFDCGGALSDGGVSTDDSEQGSLYPEMVQRSAFSSHYAKSLGCLSRGPIDGCLRRDIERRRRRPLDEETIAEVKRMQIAERKRIRWEHVKGRLRNPHWVNMDVDQRLNDVLTSDCSQFYFDDREWMHFEEPSPGIFEAYVNSRPCKI